jgi:hypothetical protein
MSIYKAITSLIPSRLIYQNKLYSITDIDNDYIINKYQIYLDNDNRIKMVKIDCDHVNSDPRTDIFCLPEELKNRHLTKKLIKEIEIVMETYNMNHPYFPPWHYIKYDKYDSKYNLKQQKRSNSLIMKSFKIINNIMNIGININ